ncbi:MAG: SPOR domain-containing protein [Gammaproteobacteria bacterium]|nr:SPOR domain-containing protein [Gammaproteobacteria bacterium]MYA67385.1 hypothetical protein [Gammaproteobacteria bacterium]MYH46196.1 hypothetical protein [Gammaproteobacteria bacterium]MYL12604.1 hypothetical protein [Gammaproteobacteria bacterium]
MKQNVRTGIALTVTILALGLIFLPMIFDPQDTAAPQLPSRIPPPPSVPVLPEPEQSRPVILSNTPAINVPEEARAVEDARTEAADGWREIPILDERGLPRGWSLRMGLFPGDDEAQQLLSQLLEAGYRAYIREQQTGPDSLRAVLVGPWLGRDTAQDYQDRLAREFGITGVILPFELRRF